MRQIVFQHWFLSHALGWMGKMMIFRDWKVCLVAPGHFVKTIDKVKIENWTGIPMPMDILVKHVLAFSLFGIWFFLRYKVMPRDELLADVDKEDAELVHRLVSERKKNKLAGRRKQSLVDMFPLKIRQKAMMYDLVDVFLVVALVPLLMLGENWAGLPSGRG